MPVTAEMMTTWCRKLLGADPDAPKRKLHDYLAAIPRLDSLADVPSAAKLRILRENALEAYRLPI